MKKNPENQVKEILGSIPTVNILHADGDYMQVRVGKHSYCIQLLKLAAGYPGHVKKIISESGQTEGCYRLILVPFMSEKTAELCKESGLGFCDEAGNCHVAFGPVYVTVTGKKNPRAQSRARTAAPRAVKRPAAVPPAAEAPQRAAARPKAAARQAAKRNREERAIKPCSSFCWWSCCWGLPCVHGAWAQPDRL